MPLASAWLIKSLLDLLAQDRRQDTVATFPQKLLLLLGAQILLAIASQIILPLSTYLKIEIEHSLTLNVQTLVYQKINSLIGLGPFEDPYFHDTIRLAAQGAQRGPSQAVGLLMTLIRSTITLTTFLGVLLSFNPLLVGAVGVAVLPQLYGRLKLGHQRFGLAIGNSPKERRATYYGQVLSGLQFAKEIRLFNLAEYFLEAFRRISLEIWRAQRCQRSRELHWQVAFAIFASVVTGGVSVAVTLQAFLGHLSLGDIVLYISAVASTQSTLGGIIVAIASLNESALFYRHFTGLLALPQPLPLADSARPAPPLSSAIELRDISFRYSDQHPWILHHVNLHIIAGQCVALVGLNGAGKTTLVKLLTRLYDPTEGQILWDGIDIRAFAVADLRARIGAIFQDFVHYDLTAYENIGLGNIARIEDTDWVQQAAHQAGVHHAINALPEGYQTTLSRWLVSDGLGADLSGGEWQKLALARMFMRTASFLILDEPTAALDAQAEHELYQSFIDLVTGRTSLLISHRFSTVRMADKIAVLEQGAITEYGSHDELMFQAGSYARLYRIQAEQYA